MQDLACKDLERGCGKGLSTVQHLKTEKYSFEREIFAQYFGDYISLPLPISEEAWQTHCTSFIQECCYCFTVICQMAPLLSRLSSALLWRMT